MERLGDVNAVGGGLVHALEKEPDPAFPVPVATHGWQPCVVLLLLPPECQVEIEQRLLDQTPKLHEQRDQQPADTAVSVEERVDRLELYMCQPDPNQGGKVAVFMPPLLQGSKRAWNLLGRRRDESLISGSAAANPVLQAADFTGQLVLAADAAHQNMAGVAQKADVQRQALRICKLSPAAGKGIRLVADFSDTDWTIRPVRSLEGEDVAQRGLRPFDPRSYDRLLPNEVVEKPNRAPHH